MDDTNDAWPILVDDLPPLPPEPDWSDWSWLPDEQAAPRSTRRVAPTPAGRAPHSAGGRPARPAGVEDEPLADPGHRVIPADPVVPPRSAAHGGVRPAWRDALLRRLPPTLAEARFRLGARGAAAVCAVAVVAVVVAVVIVFLGRPSTSRLDATDPIAATTTAPEVAVPTIAPSPTASVVVDVEGKVRDPGIHELPVGARISDALAAAGGALPGVDLSDLDLAGRVSDGAQLRVGIAAASGSSAVVGGDSAGSGTPSQDNPVDLNAATAADLDTLPGIGPSLAARIIAWREAHGPFSSVAGLGEVPGIGPSKLATLTPLVRV